MRPSCQCLAAGFLALVSWPVVLAYPTERERDGPVDGAAKVRAAVVFHQPRVQEAQDLLMDISNPTSARFGQHLDKEGIEKLFSPSRGSQDKVVGWLESAGIPRSSMRMRRAAATLEFVTDVATLESLFKTKYRLVRDAGTGKPRLDSGSDERVPAELKDHVHFVTSAALVEDRPELRKRVAVVKQQRVRAPAAAADADGSEKPVNLRDCNLSWTPACVRELYDIPLGTKAAPNNSLGIFGFGDAYDQANLDNFWNKYAPFIPRGTAPKVNSIDGAHAPGEESDGEELLDLQMAYPISWPQGAEIFQVPYNMNGGIGNEFLDAVDADYCHYDGGDDPNLDIHFPIFQGYPGPAMCGTYNVTNVVSMSFAVDEASLNRHYVERQCHEWMKLALRGVTVLVAAGDRGVQGNFGCSLGPPHTNISAFSPLFPGTCPYVTTVGATQVNFDGGRAEEVAVFDPKHNFYSGGGFSNINARPAYQDQAVADYLASHDPHYPKGTFNPQGRAIPDVALLGANLTISDKMEITVSGGTSAATPMFAAMISRINDERLLAGKRPIGFLNQILYRHPEVFTDIVQGHNPGCHTPGFQAAKGWDPVSGLGSVKFPKLRHLLVGLP
ncbi:uncharacterized protein UV8b_06627 [Ustilaginoidea virens]|uniref:Peptidase S53 domain-containing protein n=1 Tax=Ustilaginoidea virens TaxID=1159556 RepID=A0A063C628_USTVR|nr:uncharacterized protein UV8b_06627 [Ustilaginoidea virens]QUC22386.1 hypothetical protein UV8b_06627 [Ustilaginoidea virens]GAO18517.1 hypothetical protein UVI_02054590 [Ustilaginoidea virens]